MPDLPPGNRPGAPWTEIVRLFRTAVQHQIDGWEAQHRIEDALGADLNDLGTIIGDCAVTCDAAAQLDAAQIIAAVQALLPDDESDTAADRAAFTAALDALGMVLPPDGGDDDTEPAYSEKDTP